MRTRRDFLTPGIVITGVVIVIFFLWLVIADAQTHTMPGSNVVPSGASLTINSGASITAAAGSTVTGFGGTGYHSVTFIVDGSGYVLSTGTKNPVKVPFGGTLAGWVMTCKPSGSVTADVFRASNTSGLPATSIIGGSGTKPAVSSNVESSSTSFTSWTSTTITAKDNLCISLSGVIYCNLRSTHIVLSVKRLLIFMMVMCCTGLTEGAISVTRDHVTNIDVVIDFTGGSVNDLITVANLTAGTHNASGIGATWDISRTPLEHTYVVSSPSIPLLSTIAVGGVTYSSTSGRAIKYDLDQAVANGSSPLWEQQTYTFGTNSVGNYTLGAMCTFNAALGTEADYLTMYGPFSVTQFHYDSSDGRYLSSHGQLSGGSTIGPRIFIGTDPVWVSHRHNAASGITEIIVQDGTTGVFLGCSRVQGDPAGLSSLVLGDYIAPEGGNLKTSIAVLGFNANATFPIAAGNFVLPPLPLIQAYENTSNISLVLGTYLDFYNHGFVYQVERSTDTGSTWATIDTVIVPYSLVDVTTYTDSSVSGGTNYRYRVTSKLNEWSSIPVESNPVTLGAGAWTNTLDPVTSDTDDTQTSSDYQRNVSITLPSGRASKIRIYCHSLLASMPMKVALYGNSGNLLTSTTLTTGGALTDAWQEFTIPITAVTSGTYKVAWAALTTGSNAVYRYKNATGQTNVHIGTYASFPLNPIGTTDGTFNGTDAVGVFVQQP